MKKERIAQYVHRELTDMSKSRIIEFCNMIGINKNIIDELHTIIIYTKTPMKKPTLNEDRQFFTGVGTLRLWDVADGQLLLLELSDEYGTFKERNDYMLSLGGENNFPYKPHISLTYDVPIGFEDSEFIDKEFLFTLHYEGEKYEDKFEEWKPKKD